MMKSNKVFKFVMLMVVVFTLFSFSVSYAEEINASSVKRNFI